MRLGSVILLMLITSMSWSMDYKAFWRCRDNHLEALDVYLSNDKKANLRLSYIDQDKKEVLSSPINLKSLIDLPPSMGQKNFLILSDENHIFLNCVGQVDIDPHDLLGKIVFDVQRNAFKCPLIPKDCA